MNMLKQRWDGGGGGFIRNVSNRGCWFSFQSNLLGVNGDQIKNQYRTRGKAVKWCVTDTSNLVFIAIEFHTKK